MNLMEMGAMMADMPKFAAQAEDLIKSAKALTELIDKWDSEDVKEVFWTDIVSANDAFKEKLAALPKLPGMTIDG